MGRRKLTMRKIRAILYLKWSQGKSHRQIMQSIGSRSTGSIHDCIRRALAAKLSWPLPDELDDEQLEAMLYPQQKSNVRYEAVDWKHIHKELKRKGVTLQLLWMEYRDHCVDGYGYSRFCELYNHFRQQLAVWMRQAYIAGEKAFVDYAGLTVAIRVNISTGETIQAQIFVMVLGASNYIYAEATLSQSLPDWIASHRRAFEFFGGVMELLIPDNLKSGVTKPHRYDPDNNPTYHEMAQHYGTAIMPARVRKPTDKAKAEQSVKQVEQQILAPLRNHTFFSLAELNCAIKEKLKHVNAAPFQKLDGSRQSLFEEMEKPALKPLPKTPYVFGEWKSIHVDGSYHVEVDGHYYSVPYRYTKKQVDIRYTSTMVQCFCKGKQIALHQRSHKKGAYTTLAEHMPEKHRIYAKWTPERVQAQAEKIGPHTKALVAAIFDERDHPYIAARTCLGILRLAQRNSEPRLELACQRALAIGGLNFQSIESILKHQLEKEPLPGKDKPEQSALTQKPHENLRDHQYYS